LISVRYAPVATRFGKLIDKGFGVLRRHIAGLAVCAVHVAGQSGALPTGAFGILMDAVQILFSIEVSDVFEGRFLLICSIYRDFNSRFMRGCDCTFAFLI
jgi:hypothetical protein